MIQIENRRISPYEKPYIIADISSNHKQDRETAKDLVYAAKEAGVDAVKFQHYIPKDITLDPDLFDLYYRSYANYDIENMLWSAANEVGITMFASVFSPLAIEYLQKRNCPAYKIASFEIHHMKLLEAVKKTGKPIFISTGMMSYSDLTWFSTNFSSTNTILMKCVSNYPALPSDFHLRTITELRSQWFMGISDHTLSLGVSLAAVALGAAVIERHFTLKRDGGVDDCCSLEPKEMKRLVLEAGIVWESLGNIDYTVHGDRKYMRSLYSTKDIKKGEVFTEENIDALRPNKGISPKAIYSFFGKNASRDIKQGEPLHMRDME